QLHIAEAVPAFPIAAVCFCDGQVAAQHAFETVRWRRNVGHELMQISAGDAGAQAEIRFVWNCAVKKHVGGKFATVKVGLQIGDGDTFVHPEHSAADLREVEFPVVKRPAGQLKTEV